MLYLNLIIMQWFLLWLKHFAKYLIWKRRIQAGKKIVWAQNEIGGEAPSERDPFNNI